MLELRRKAEAEAVDIQEITFKQVKQIIAIAPAEAGMGADGWRVRQWQQLPEEAVRDLTKILVNCEAKLAFPGQTLLNE
eukprot:9829215-Heterocapsa_arctica.AAC.1